MHFRESVFHYDIYSYHYVKQLVSKNEIGLITKSTWPDLTNTQRVIGSVCVPTVHVFMSVNVIKSRIIIITLLVFKRGWGRSGHHGAYSTRGLMCSLSYCNASVNINATYRPNVATCCRSIVFNQSNTSRTHFPVSLVMLTTCFHATAFLLETKSEL